MEKLIIYTRKEKGTKQYSVVVSQVETKGQKQIQGY